MSLQYAACIGQVCRAVMHVILLLSWAAHCWQLVTAHVMVENQSTAVVSGHVLSAAMPNPPPIGACKHALSLTEIAADHNMHVPSLSLAIMHVLRPRHGV